MKYSFILAYACLIAILDPMLDTVHATLWSGMNDAVYLSLEAISLTFVWGLWYFIFMMMLKVFLIIRGLVFYYMQLLKE